MLKSINGAISSFFIFEHTLKFFQVSMMTGQS